MLEKGTKSAYYAIAARVETEVKSPAAIMITSALEADGTTMVASCLADALAYSGYRVAVIDVREEEPIRPPQANPIGPSERSVASSVRTYASLAIRDLGDGFAGSRRDVAMLVSRLRSRYDYIIVDAPAFSTGALPIRFSDVCDAVIVAVVRGRAAVAPDRDINAFFDEGKKRAIGIVATTRAAIAEFEAAEAHVFRRSVPMSEFADDRSSSSSVVAGSV